MAKPPQPSPTPVPPVEPIPAGNDEEEEEGLGAWQKEAQELRQTVMQLTTDLATLRSNPSATSAEIQEMREALQATKTELTAAQTKIQELEARPFQTPSPNPPKSDEEEDRLAAERAGKLGFRQPRKWL